MPHHFVWTWETMQSLHHASRHRKQTMFNPDALSKTFERVIEAGEHYYFAAAENYARSKTWKNINKSSIHRGLERNEKIFGAIGLLFTVIELQKVYFAPPDSIIVVTPDIGGCSFEVIEPKDPRYREAFMLLPGAT